MVDAILVLVTHAIPVLLALTLPTALQAHLADRLGDRSARAEGRLSWDPFKHADTIGTYVLPAVFLLLLGGLKGFGFMLGWAKPLNINPRAFRHFRRDVLIVESAVILGPFVLAMLWAVLGALCLAVGLDEPFLYRVINAGVLVSLSFFAVCLLPFPPLPLGNALLRVLPYRMVQPLLPLLQWAPFILMGLLIVGVLSPLVRFFFQLGAIFVFPIYNPLGMPVGML
ncbi:MAG TPA: site-2 protease family protein [Burkholderiaceae bacterium]|nr:site-2 protease family protein [Burkholderiaceae bacterium]